ncbi:MAG: aspartate--tRNA ligase [Gemmatimonas sp.]|nr:aspartate--tRNA ligase [Gemmatimonas sp.]
MTDVLRTSFRTGLVGSLRTEDAGTRAILVGWVHRRRDLGGLVFLDLRDRAGLLQVSFDPEAAPAEAIREARGLGPEDVVQVEGTVELRPRGKINADLPTGEVELRAESLRVLQRADPLPIPVYRTPDEELPMEDLRLRYRYLDLRRPEIQRNLMLRHTAARSARSFLDANGFVEVETPMLTRRTPEGARDYLVPSRVHPGEFFALPQSPQIYKQLLMVSGYDRYYQIVRCLRDEDLRADRQPEFTQIDAELSFVDEEDVFRIGEGMVAQLWRDVLEVDLPVPFPRLTYDQALRSYGTDKPDLRYGLEIVDVTETLQRSDFRIFSGTLGSDQRIRGVRVPGGAQLSRREIDELQLVAKRGGAPGTLWVKKTESGWSGPFAKALGGDVASSFEAESGTVAGDLFVAVVGYFRTGSEPGEQIPPWPESETPREAALDELRRHLADRMGLVRADEHAWAWVTEFPMFDWDPDNGRLVASHHMFTAPHQADIEMLKELTDGDFRGSRDAAWRLYSTGLRSRAYDAVYNGNELASGSVRIHDQDLQRIVFRSLGLSEEEAREKFGFLLEAFRFGAPPHAGFAFGLDRLAMLLAGAASLRDVIAFPKTTAARALFEGAPAPVDDADLREVHIRKRDDETN